MEVQVKKMKSKNIKKESKAYLDDIKKCLTCSSSLRTTFIRDLSSRVDMYIEENNIESIDDIIKYFGTPNEIAENFYSVNDINKLKRKAKIHTLIITALLILTVLLVVFVVYAIIFIDQNGGGITINNY